MTTKQTRDTVATILNETLDAGAVDRLVPAIYDELRRMAQGQMSRERPGHTLCTSSLVHEAYLRLADADQTPARGRTYFFGAAARAMRRILIDHARRKNRDKRGGDWQRVTLATGVAACDSDAEFLDLEAAITALAEIAPRQASVVECRYFGGMTVEEIANLLEVSARTIMSDWALARAWLFRELHGGDPT